MQSGTSIAVDLFEHGSLILRVLTELRPRRVACLRPGARFEARLTGYAGTLGFEITADAGAAELVISGAGDYRSVRELLDRLRDRPVAAVIGGTAWPCGRRDARASLDDLLPSERERYAFRLPVPAQPRLSDSPSPVAFATTEGGPGNGVRTAVEDGCRETPEAWDLRLVPGFGGAAVLLPVAQATAERWARILRGEDSESVLPRLELANVQLRLDRERLLDDLDQARARRAELESETLAVAQNTAAIERQLGMAVSDLKSMAQELTSREDLGLQQRLTSVGLEVDRRLANERARELARERALAAEQAGRAQVARWLTNEQAANSRKDATLAGLTGELQGLKAELGRLTLALERQSRELEQLRLAYDDERAFVLLQASRIAESSAWRWGHRLAVLRGRILFRRTRGTDAVTRLLERATKPPSLPPPPGP